MTNRHIHSILNIIFGLLRKLRLVAHVLGILEAGARHTHYLGSAIVLFSLIVVAPRVTDCLELWPVVNSVYFYWTRNHFLGVWAVLSASGFSSYLLSFLTALGGI